jgi:hypothetical protein
VPNLTGRSLADISVLLAVARHGCSSATLDGSDLALVNTPTPVDVEEPLVLGRSGGTRVSYRRPGDAVRV